MDSVIKFAMFLNILASLALVGIVSYYCYVGMVKLRSAIKERKRHVKNKR